MSETTGKTLTMMGLIIMGIVFMICMTVLIGCIPRKEESQEEPISEELISTDMPIQDYEVIFEDFICPERTVCRFVDHEKGVMCWYHDQGYSGGLSCLPLSQLGGIGQ